MAPLISSNIAKGRNNGDLIQPQCCFMCVLVCVCMCLHTGGELVTMALVNQNDSSNTVKQHSEAKMQNKGNMFQPQCCSDYVCVLISVCVCVRINWGLLGRHGILELKWLF